MDKYEYKQLSERMIELMQNEEYGEAKEIADSIDWRRVRNAMMLANVSDIYERPVNIRKAMIFCRLLIIGQKEAGRYCIV